MKNEVIGRLAPSPTGFLHLGNAWSFLLAWLWAKSLGGRVFLRMEDIDPNRSKGEFARAIEEDLNWLGLSWDGIIVKQSTRYNLYNDALTELEQGGYIYPCYCTRKELRSLAGAPHVEDMGAPYPGICRNLSPQELFEKQGRAYSLRLCCPQDDAANIYFNDVICGEQHFNLHACGGDFALRRSDGVFAYQLAVVVDDAAQGVTHILRGEDILISTPRQILLYDLLMQATPKYAHVPLLLDEQGERLAKRHEALSLRSLRAQGVISKRVVGLLAYLAGIRDGIYDVAAHELVQGFCLEKCNFTKHMQKGGIVVKTECLAKLEI